MSNIDDWLNSIGMETNTSLNPTPMPQESLPVSTESTAASSQDEPHAESISEEDFNDILQDIGFQEAEDAEIVEEVGEDTNGVYDENGGEGRDLDIEENADWERLADAGVLNPDNLGRSPAMHIAHSSDIAATWHNDAGVDRIDLRVGDILVESVPVEDEALEAVQSVNGDGYPSENPDLQEDSISQDAALASPEEPLLPPNSPTLLMDDSTSRFSGAEWYNEIQKKRIVVAGLGGIGSWLSFQLSRLHPEAIYLYDDDTVELGNMSGQLFGIGDVGHFKAETIGAVIRKYSTESHVYVRNERFEADTPPNRIMVCGFDNMAARRTFFESWKRLVDSLESHEDKRSCLFLDGRLSIDTLQVYCIQGDDCYNIEKYDNNCLFSDEEADETVCSLKQTTYLACMIGSMMTNLFVNWTASLLDPVIPYDLPFFTEYDAQNMIFKTEY